MLVNPTLHKSLATRARMLQFTRRFLDERGFTEVETPVLSAKVGGAVARPFTTRANALGGEAMSMRIAPELFLKVGAVLAGRFLAECYPYSQQLVIGGMDKVYEIGKQFRNEGLPIINNTVMVLFSWHAGIDSNHNPEFTTCEFYEAYGDFPSLVTMTEAYIKGRSCVACVPTVYSAATRACARHPGHPCRELADDGRENTVRH